MEILFLSITFAMPAAAVGLHLMWIGCGCQPEVAARLDDKRQPACEEAAPADYVNTAVAAAEVQFAGIMAILARLECYIDQLPDKVQ